MHCEGAGAGAVKGTDAELRGRQQECKRGGRGLFVKHFILSLQFCGVFFLFNILPFHIVIRHWSICRGRITNTC